MKIKKGFLFMALIGIAAASLFSCAKKPEGKIVSVEYIASSMAYSDCFSFRLAEKDGEVLFSCDAEATDGERIELEDVPVDRAVMTDFRERAEQSNLAKAALSYKKPLLKFFVHDAPTASYTLKWEDGSEAAAREKPPAADELRAFFVSVAERYKEGSAKLPEGALTFCFISASASWYEGCYSFDLRQEEGRWLLSARFTEVIQTEDEDWDSCEIRLEDEPITPGSAERIRAAAEEVGLRERLTAAANRWTPERDDDAFPLDATTYSIGASWEDGTFYSDGGWGDPPQDALFEALKNAAKDAANPAIAE